MTTPIRLGGGHCCVCAGVCHHIGPVQVCGRHAQPAPTFIVIGSPPPPLVTPTCPTCCTHDHTRQEAPR